MAEAIDGGILRGVGFPLKLLMESWPWRAEISFYYDESCLMSAIGIKR